MGAGSYAQAEVHCESSGLARTLQSAYALHAGLFPGGSVPGGAAVVPVPVYSRPPGEDFILRGHTMCSAIGSRLEAWYGSEEFQARSAESKAFRPLEPSLQGAECSEAAAWERCLAEATCRPMAPPHLWRCLGLTSRTSQVVEGSHKRSVFS